MGTFSNYGATSVDVGAPGVHILSTYSGGAYAYLDGTSMAAPHVTGIAALLWSFQPTLSIAQIKNAILETGDDVASLVGKTATGKRVNAYNALQSVSSVKAVTAFNLTDPLTVGTIDEGTHAIQLTLPAAMPVTALIPTTITITGASVSPLPGVAQDFTSPVTYTVTAFDGSTQPYTVTTTPSLDKSFLTSIITREVGGNHAAPVYVLTQADYVGDSWTAYGGAVDAAIGVETDIEATIPQIIDSVTAVNNTKLALIFAGKSALDAAKNAEALLVSAHYTDYTAVTAALALPETTNAEVLAKTTALNDAMGALVFIGEAALEEAVIAANSTVELDHTPASWILFLEARTNALALPETTNAEMLAKTIALNTAIAGLVTVVDNTLLLLAISPTTSLVQANYTVDSWTALSTALALPETSNALVIEKTEAINTAFETLVRAFILDNTTSEVSVTTPSAITIQS